MNLKDIKEYRNKVKAAQFEAGAKMFLDRIFSNFEVKLEDCFPDTIFYESNNKLIAEYHKKNKNFYYNYNRIYRILIEEFKLTDFKINELIVGKVEEHLKFNEITAYNFASVVGFIYKDKLNM